MLNPIKNHKGVRAKYGTLNSTLDHKSMNLLNDSETVPSHKNSKNDKMKIENNDMPMQPPSNRYSMQKPKYTKNINLPSMMK